MTMGESSEVRHHDCSNCNLKSSLDMVTSELQKVIDEYNKITQEKTSKFFLKQVKKLVKSRCNQITARNYRVIAQSDLTDP